MYVFSLFSMKSNENGSIPSGVSCLLFIDKVSLVDSESMNIEVFEEIGVFFCLVKGVEKSSGDIGSRLRIFEGENVFIGSTNLSSLYIYKQL